jgi:hypothetical protein
MKEKIIMVLKFIIIYFILCIIYLVIRGFGEKRLTETGQLISNIYLRITIIFGIIGFFMAFIDKEKRTAGAKSIILFLVLLSLTIGIFELFLMKYPTYYNVFPARKLHLNENLNT